MKYAASCGRAKCNFETHPEFWANEVERVGPFYDTQEEAIENMRLPEEEPKTCYLFIANDDMSYNDIQVIKLHETIEYDEYLNEDEIERLRTIAVLDYDDLNEATTPQERIRDLNTRISEIRLRIQALKERIQTAQQSTSRNRSIRVGMLQLDIQIAQLDIQKAQLRIERTQMQSRLIRESENFGPAPDPIAYEEYLKHEVTPLTANYEVPKTAILPEAPGQPTDKVQAYVRDQYFNNQVPYYTVGIKSTNQDLKDKWTDF